MESNHSVYELTLEILTQLYKDAKSLDELNNHISNNLLNILQAQKIQTHLRAESIRRCVSDFYYRHGFHILLIFQKNNTLKLIPTLRDSSNNFYIDFLIAWIGLNFSPQEELTTEVFQAIFNYAKQNLMQDDLLCRDIVRNGVKKFFSLDARDSLFFKNLNPRIKKFNHDFVQINEELRKIKKLDSSILLSEADRSLISHLLKQIPLKANLSTITTHILKYKMSLSHINQENFYQDLLHLVIQDFRIDIGKILSSTIASLNLTCFAQEYVLSHKKTVFSAFAHLVLEAHYYRTYNVDSIMIKYINKIPINNPKLKKTGQFFYNTEDFENICNEYFNIQKSIATIRQKLQDIECQIDEKSSQIDKIQQDIKIKNTILENLNNTYETKKQLAKTIDVDDEINKEATDIAIVSFIDEQKLMLKDLEKMAEQLEGINTSKSILDEEKNEIFAQIQKVQLASQAQEKDFELLAQSLGDVIIQNEL